MWCPFIHTRHTFFYSIHTFHSYIPFIHSYILQAKAIIDSPARRLENTFFYSIHTFHSYIHTYYRQKPSLTLQREGWRILSFIPFIHGVRSPAVLRLTGESMMAFACNITILKCFFFILLHFFVGALPCWLQTICQHYFLVSAFLHCLIHGQFMIFRAVQLFCDVLLFIFSY